jgi:hypothetical protein
MRRPPIRLLLGQMNQTLLWLQIQRRLDSPYFRQRRRQTQWPNRLQRQPLHERHKGGFRMLSGRQQTRCFQQLNLLSEAFHLRRQTQ